MKKIKFLLSLMLVFIFALYLNVYSFAYYEQYAHEAPGGTAGQWVSGAYVSDMVASDTPVYPDMVAFYYKPSTIKSLPTTFANSSSRAFYMYVMEDDIGDYDDYVKYYTGTFSGRTLSGITFSHTCTDDSIQVARKHKFRQSDYNSQRGIF